MASWRCMICLIFVALTLKVLLSHINVAHGRCQEFWVHCGIDECEQEFRVFNSFFRHIKRTHPAYLKHGVPPSGWRTTPTSRSLGVETFGVSIFSNSTTIITPATTNSVELAPGSSRAETPQVQVLVPDEADAVSSTTTLNVTRSAAALALSVREQCHLSQRTVNSIISEVQQYQAVLINALKERMRRVFEEHPERSPQLQDEALSVLDTFVDPFSANAYGQNKTYREIFDPVTPVEVVVSQKICWVKRGGARIMSLKNSSFYYVPLIQSLKQLLSNSRIFTMLNRIPPRNREGFLGMPTTEQGAKRCSEESLGDEIRASVSQKIVDIL
ncbi:uncharacterized protein LOC114458772 [Gouania willdenowi]|uniref:uncharacterized protein LOC114458772 n=1 Tax=Gouania willdenowi TaxID=441366 RepID=UPI001055B334|nr:uncharacterized protein LOC114458772 [Gouania willdenowi]